MKSPIMTQKTAAQNAMTKPLSTSMNSSKSKPPAAMVRIMISEV